MKRLLSVFIILLLVFSLSGCKQKDNVSITGKSEYTVSKLENALELQKSIFRCKVLSVDVTKALIPKYNSDITDYTVYTVKVSECFNGYTPLSEIKVYCLGTTELFGQRINLQKNESYILDAEPWVYGDNVVYLLSPFEKAFFKIDSAGRIILSENETKAKDLGTIDDYTAALSNAKASLLKRLPNFYSTKQTIERYKTMFDNIKKTNDKSWLKDFKYNYIPDDSFISLTRSTSKVMAVKVSALALKQALTEVDFESIFK